MIGTDHVLCVIVGSGQWWLVKGLVTLTEVVISTSIGAALWSGDYMVGGTVQSARLHGLWSSPRERTQSYRYSGFVAEDER